MNTKCEFLRIVDVWIESSWEMLFNLSLYISVIIHAFIVLDSSPDGCAYLGQVRFKCGNI